MKIIVCHARCEHCDHDRVADLDVQMHQCGDGQFALSAVCADRGACAGRRAADRARDLQLVAHARH